MSVHINLFVFNSLPYFVSCLQLTLNIWVVIRNMLSVCLLEMPTLDKDGVLVTSSNAYVPNRKFRLMPILSLQPLWLPLWLPS